VLLKGAGKRAPIAVAWQFNVVQNAIDFTAEIKRLSDSAPVTVKIGVCVHCFCPLYTSLLMLLLFFFKFLNFLKMTEAHVWSASFSPSPSSSLLCRPLHV
jgi:hypothetical protein